MQMTEVAALNRDAAKRHPESVFGSPLDIVNEIMLTKGEKLAALSRWRLSIIGELGAPNVTVCTRGQLTVLGEIDEANAHLKKGLTAEGAGH